ncbi:ABC transporter substrate-binding protein [Brevibacillus fluminis]|uniref:ABC transporter substrate-binding protein n=1 Tax=Brevibacillus fluminis TaxID=511487 RepID=A0A3M8CT10_9BACL|nr:ABC transporter substrate-binding protein [Brevibacillus fluminis]RNB78521.1 ABC transporter substrate-binding protein [Brevibacillus fluminis]
MFKNTRNRTAYLTFVCLLVISLIGCSSAPTPSSNEGGKSSSSEPQKGGTLTIAETAEPDTLDAQKTFMSQGDFVSGFMGGSLLTFDPQTNELKPYLAESYTISEDGKTVTFKIRTGVKFHDGTPLNAAAFKASYERALAKETASPITASNLPSVKSLSAPDDTTLIFHLEKPAAPLLPHLTYQGYMQPLSMEAIKKFGKEYGRNPVGVGPWKFESWKTGESVSMVRNEEFNWALPYAENKGAPRPDKLVIKFIKDNQTMLAALDSGAVDIATVRGKDIKKYKNNDKFTVLEGTEPVMKCISMNVENEFLKDVNVRKAINLAINKEALIQADLQGEGVPVYGPIPSMMFGYDPAVEQYGYKYSVEEAKKMLEAAGWKENAQGIREKGGKTLSLSLMISDAKPGNQLVQSMLKEIGIDVQMKMVETAAFFEEEMKGTYDLAMDEYGDVDPDILFLMMHSSQIGVVNPGRINNKEIDTLLEKGRMTRNEEDRKKIYTDIQKVTVEQAFMVPLYTSKVFKVVNNRVQGAKQNPMAKLSVYDMWIKQ